MYVCVNVYIYIYIYMHVHHNAHLPSATSLLLQLPDTTPKDKENTGYEYTITVAQVAREQHPSTRPARKVKLNM